MAGIIVLTPLFILRVLPLVISPSQAQTPPSFIFTAAGDYSSNAARTTTVLSGMNPVNSGASFNWALGDLSYGSLTPETVWCDYVKNNAGADFPFQLIPGNHEDDSPAGNNIDNFELCLPDRLGGITGRYSREYYFDYPQNAPLARFIAISPQMIFNDEGQYTYSPGSAHYNFVVGAIDSARAAGIRWIVVGMHVNCISMGSKSCGMGVSLFNLLVEKKVDLILQGHDHNYQRSKQLSFGPLCSGIVPGSYNADCVADDGSDNLYTKGAGSIVAIVGTGGGGLYDINPTDSEAGYFARWMGNNINATWGFLKGTVSATSMSLSFNPMYGSDFTDSFTIVDTSTPTDTPVPPTMTPTPFPTAAQYLFGTLLTDSTHTNEEYSAGVRAVHLEVGWDQYEPTNNTFNTAYIDSLKSKLATYQAEGMKVVLGAGLQYPPVWVKDNPDYYYINQYGVSSRLTRDDPNLTFSQGLRDEVSQYFARLNQDLGLNNFWAVRVGSGGLIETLYPSENDGTNVNSYWAYDNAALTGAGLPASVSVNPFPLWKPGETTITVNEVGQWYDWYLNSLADGVNWQITTYKNLGFSGFFHVLMPGQGVRPASYETAVNNYLDGTGNSNHTMGRGAAWNKVIEKITDKQNAVIYVSSMADGSGSNDLCQAGDVLVDINDPAINFWSATRWIAYNAHKFDLSLNGENPGRNPTNNYGLTMMQTTATQMEACGFEGMMWAHDFNLYDGVSGVTLADYQNIINQYNIVPTVTPTSAPTSVPSPTATPQVNPNPITVSSRVSSSSDDAEERISSGSVSLGSSDLELGADGSNSQMVGMRFNNVQIPQGALIDNAYIEFEVDEVTTGATSVIFSGQAADNAAAFSSSTNNISSRPTTVAQVAWNNIPAWSTVSSKQQSPDISSIFSEIVNRPGWASGNSLVVTIQGSGRRTAESFNGESANAPLLVMTYIPSLTSTPIPTPLPSPSSAPTPTATSTPTPFISPAPEILTLNPMADTFVNVNSANSNYGNITALEIDGSPLKISYLKFDLSPLAGKVILSANLRLRITNSSKSTQTVKSMTDTSWQENQVTYNSRPGLGAVITSIPGGKSGNWLEIAITADVSAKAGLLYSIGIDSTGGDGLDAYSKENSSNKPELSIYYR